MSKVLLYTAIGLMTIAVLIIGFDHYVLGDGWLEIARNTSLNIVAEFVGIAVGVLTPLIIASKLASEKLDVLGRPIVELVAQLRIEKKISKQSARNCVKCAAMLISEAALKKDISLSVYPRGDTCDVCDLPIDIQPDNKCEHCKLSDHIWNLEKNKELHKSEA